MQDIAASGGAAIAVQADVTDTAAVLAMVKLIERELGPVEVLVCNAVGVSDPVFGAVLDVAPEAVETIVLAQLRAVLTPARAVLPAMVARRRGSLVVVSSQLARSPKPGCSALSMAKGAVEAAARAMAVELGPHGVRVNTVAPGPTLTDAAAWASAEVRRGWADRAPLRRNALAGDVAGTIAFLASDAARFVTGGHLAADGGAVMP
jgi:NAD(P)-dependent dehydrogenase (short-subunit alcohol dehydrogenase family)